jgi:hypothetical protein
MCDLEFGELFSEFEFEGLFGCFGSSILRGFASVSESLILSTLCFKLPSSREASEVRVGTLSFGSMSSSGASGSEGPVFPFLEHIKERTAALNDLTSCSGVLTLFASREVQNLLVIERGTKFFLASRLLCKHNAH